MIMTFSGFKGYIFICALIFTCVFACMTLVGAFEPCGNMSTRTRKLNEKGTELLERNLRGKCASALRCATTVANKLGPILKSATIDDIDLVQQYSAEFDTKISLVVDAYTNYSEKFVGDLEILGDFNSWFKPRFNVLKELQHFASDFFSQLLTFNRTIVLLRSCLSRAATRRVGRVQRLVENQNQVPVVKSLRVFAVDCLAPSHQFG